MPRRSVPGATYPEDARHGQSVDGLTVGTAGQGDRIRMKSAYVCGKIGGAVPKLATTAPPLTTRLSYQERAMPQSTPLVSCRQCGKPFAVKPYRVGVAKFCSLHCYGEAMRIAADARGRKWYKRNRSPSERRYEHRDVAEAMLGRPLAADEVVHHKDGDKANNDPGNLDVMSRADHARLHAGALGRWAGAWECCVCCGTTERKHHGNGWCERCRSREQQRLRRMRHAQTRDR